MNERHHAINKVYAETRRELRRNRELRKYTDRFLIFQNPPKLRSNLLVLTYRPSGSPLKREMQGPPTKNYPLTRNHRFFLMMRAMFHSAQQFESLRHSNVMDCLFFAPKKNAKTKISNNALTKISESHSRSQLPNLLNALKPKYVVVAGVDAYKFLVQLYGNSFENDWRAGKTGKLKRVGLPRISYLCIVHFSYGGDEKLFEKSITGLKKFLSQLSP